MKPDFFSGDQNERIESLEIRMYRAEICRRDARNLEAVCAIHTELITDIYIVSSEMFEQNDFRVHVLFWRTE